MHGEDPFDDVFALLDVPTSSVLPGPSHGSSAAASTDPKRKLAEECLEPSTTQLQSLKRPKTHSESKAVGIGERMVWAQWLREEFGAARKACGHQARPLRLQSCCSGMCTEEFAFKDIHRENSPSSVPTKAVLLL